MDEMEYSEHPSSYEADGTLDCVDYHVVTAYNCLLRGDTVGAKKALEDAKEDIEDWWEAYHADV